MAPTASQHAVLLQSATRLTRSRARCRPQLRLVGIKLHEAQKAAGTELAHIRRALKGSGVNFVTMNTEAMMEALQNSSVTPRAARQAAAARRELAAEEELQVRAGACHLSVCANAMHTRLACRRLLW